MIRIIVREVDVAGAIYVGSPPEVQYRTFDVDAPDLESFLRAATPTVQRSVVGAEAATGEKGEG